MLRKFLHMLKGSAPNRDFDGSYLDFLLLQAHPGALARLQACAQHDPLLVLTTEILSQTHFDAWSKLGDSPLADAQSPPATPAADDAPAIEDEDEPQAAPAPEDPGSVALDAQDDLDPVAAPAAPAGAAHDNASRILQAGRVFLGLLIENDRLPPEMQLSAAEVLLSRDLLLGYFFEDAHIEPKAQELLGLVEQKFNEAAFTQARILLRLFQTDRATRINNDRNLFYEEMILHMGIRRRNKVRAALLEQFNARIADALAQKARTTPDMPSEVALDAGYPAAAQWLDESLHVTLHLFTREPALVEHWRAYAQASARPGAEAYLLRFVPPRRWRPLLPTAGPTSQRIVEHISAATVKQYLVRQLKAAYFVLRAVGDTGLEPFLDDYFDWVQKKFNINGVRMMPMLYRQTMADAHMVDLVFHQFFDRHFKKKAAEFLRSFDPPAILAAADATLEALGTYDYNKIPPGAYDLGGLILDRLFDFGYHEPEFAFKLHRLT